MTTHDTTSRPRGSGTRDRLPWPALAVLAVACFAAVLIENLPAGMLPAMAGDLAVSEPAAGALVWVFALASALTALPLVVRTRVTPRRRLLLALLAGFVLADAATAAAGSYPVALVARAVAGIVTGVMWSMLAGYAARIVPGPRVAAAVAVVLAGSTVALSAGLPAGTFLGAVLGWRAVFWLLACVGVVLLVATRVLVPDAAGDPRNGSPRRLLTRPGTGAVAVVSLLVGAGHNALYTYIAPFLAPTALPGGVTGALLAFGLGSLAGNAVAGRLLDRHLRGVALGATVGLVVVLAVLASAADLPAVALTAVAAWGVVFGAVPALCQTAALRVSGQNSVVAVAVAITMYNVGIAAGSAAAGAAFDVAGVHAVAWLAFALSLPAALVVAAARRAGFR